MKNKILLSATLMAMLSGSLVAKGMDAALLERLEAMEKEMNKLKDEVVSLKEKNQQILANTKASVPSIGDVDEDEEDEDDLEDRLYDIEENLAELNRNTNGNHLKFGLDYRYSIENMSYKMADGSKHRNRSFMTNRLWINAGYQATNNLSFAAQLAYNKAFGARSGSSDPNNNAFETFDWIANENAYDDTLRVRSAYLFYKDMEFLGLDIPWTFSIGRRPSTDGHLVSLRDDNQENSPLGHSINVEFDGLSSSFMLNQPTGTYVKFCAGRGMSNAAPRFASTPYAKDKTDNGSIDLAGLIFVPYDDKHYSVATQYYYANNLIDVKNPADYTKGFDTVGGLHSGTIQFKTVGVGEGISDYLDDTILFASFAVSKTNPKSHQGMLGSKAGESKTGTSFWLGAQFPSLISDGRWGVEYNHGSKYWRSITYGEDTNIGSKLATRGDAYEVYFTEYLVDDILSLQLRYTYLDYKYSGSNGFFGNTSGDAMSMSDAINGGNGANTVSKAQDLRLYLRYRY
ncbi:MAG: DUF3373 family protein [Sulfurimonadaceae bacterium]|nr:DUF3373 family protein [Sulfurimonadaceae bacterium]